MIKNRTGSRKSIKNQRVSENCCQLAVRMGIFSFSVADDVDKGLFYF